MSGSPGRVSAGGAPSGPISPSVTDTCRLPLHPAPDRRLPMDHDDPADQHVVEVFGALADVLPYDQPVYFRTVHMRAVTFTCQS